MSLTVPYRIPKVQLDGMYSRNRLLYIKDMWCVPCSTISFPE